MYKESDLSDPVVNYFLKKGYTVKCEVKNCDIVAKKDNELIIIELKKNLNITLLYQALERQKITSLVYIAVVRKKYKEIKKMKQLVKQLGLGLMLVDINSPNDLQIVLEPLNIKKRVSKKRKYIEKEIENRKLNINKGGVTKQKIFTAYFENSIKIAIILNKEGFKTSKELKNIYNCSENTYSILYNNQYKWFQKGEKRGEYGISQKGKEALFKKEYIKIIKFYEKEIYNM